MNSVLNSTESLISDVDYSYIKNNSNTKNVKKAKLAVNALKINEKTLVIKGYNEKVDDVLLNTINLNIENIDKINKKEDEKAEPIEFFDSEITPILIDMDLNEGIVQLADNDGDIIEYEVSSGDTLSSIAKKFDITVDTILWANDLNSKSSIKLGQKLVILPVSGISYKVKSGDTVSGLASRFKVSESDIIGFNKTVDNKLVIGESIIIPGAKVNNSSSNTNKKTKDNSNTTSSTGSMAKPIGSGSVKTQGIHGHNGVDFGAPTGTSVYAALDGVVTLVRNDGGWNGGYGNYVVIKHKNGVQTLYAHLDSVNVSKGDNVGRGDKIARSGNTGRSTGPHLHFEVRGAKNPF